ncbi:MAG TPA: outer membrane protein transport protein, partial [Gemmatimonadales bacterium]|nr:outer membrane protein transport protein [Gemmatimonadales bacterium]
MRLHLYQFAIVGALAASVGNAREALAQGYGVYEQGSCTMARAGAAVASPCNDGSAIFFNPAALVNAPNRVSIGGTLIAPSGGFTNSLTGHRDDLANKVYPVPHAFVTAQLRPRLVGGIGLFAPYGLTSDWSPDAEGRFLGHHSRIEGLYLQPTLAYQLTPRVSVGAGFDLSLVSVGLKRRVDLAGQLVPGGGGLTFANLGIASGTDFADVNLTGNGTGVGYHIGVLVRATDRLSFGARYLSRQLVKISDGKAEISQVNTGLVVPADLPSPTNPGVVAIPRGTPIDIVLAPEFANGGPLADQSAATYLRFPDQLVLGLAYQVTPRAKLLFDYQYTNWHVFDQLEIDLANLGPVVYYQNNHETHDFRLGGEYALSESTELRLGAYTHNAAAPSSAVIPNLPEGPRTSFTAGLGTRLTNSLHLDLAYQYIDQADRRGRTVDLGPVRPRGTDNN